MLPCNRAILVCSQSRAAIIFGTFQTERDQMLYQTILVPYDCSEHAQEALIEAARFANENNEVCLRIVNIVNTEKLAEEKLAAQDPQDPNPPYSRSDIDTLYNAVVADANEQTYQSIGDLLNGLENEIVIELIEETHPGDQILSYATQHNCDLIIMGSRGLGAVRGFLGSVSTHVLRSSNIPVMILR